MRAKTDEEVPFIEQHGLSQRLEPRHNRLLPWILVVLLSTYIIVTSAVQSLKAEGNVLPQQSSDFGIYKHVSLA